jgi:hypothetical protein
MSLQVMIIVSFHLCLTSDKEQTAVKNNLADRTQESVLAHFANSLHIQS